MGTLLFVDTSIWLRFYEHTGREQSPVLQKILAHSDLLITTEQVEMEFLKGRSVVLNRQVKQLKPPDWGPCQLPAMMKACDHATRLEKAKEQTKQAVNDARMHLRRMLQQPNEHDPVYNAILDLFARTGSRHLSSSDSLFAHVRKRAFQRHILGYPPRKDRDTTAGDALNWEWVVECAKANGASVIIVSTDGDYGCKAEQDQTAFVVDGWLHEEFRRRVGRDAEIRLTDLLAEGLEMAGVEVTPEEAEEEREARDSAAPVVSFSPAIAHVFRPDPQERMHYWYLGNLSLGSATNNATGMTYLPSGESVRPVGD